MGGDKCCCHTCNQPKKIKVRRKRERKYERDPRIIGNLHGLLTTNLYSTLQKDQFEKSFPRERSDTDSRFLQKKIIDSSISEVYHDLEKKMSLENKILQKAQEDLQRDVEQIHRSTDKIYDEQDELRNLISREPSPSEEREFSESHIPIVDIDLEGMTQQELNAARRGVNLSTIYGSEKMGKEAVGRGEIGTGMSDYEINMMMKNIPNYQPCISSDEISTLIPRKKMCFIMNLDPSSKGGSHWVAVYIDTIKDQEVDYYDPLSDPPTASFSHDIKNLIDRLNPSTLLKYKINTVRNQKATTDTCGYMCINFLNKRNHGISFKDATGYIEPHIDNSDIYEKEADKIRFQYI